MLFRSKRREQLLKAMKKFKDGGINDDIQDVISLFSKELSHFRTPILNSTKTFYLEFLNHFNYYKKKIKVPELSSKPFHKSIKEVFNHMNPQLRVSVENQMKHTFSCEIFVQKTIKIYISTENNEDTENINKYFYLVIIWLHIVINHYASSICMSQPLSIYIMLSDLKKLLPSGECLEDQCVIKNTSVNTGYSSSCRHIVIYRKEEWLKVFIHETIHNFNLDFSSCYQYQEANIKKIFGINNDRLYTRLYEAYTESLARMIKALFVTYEQFSSSTINADDFVKKAHDNITLEQINAYFQVAKIIKYQKLSLNKNMSNFGEYREDTANLSYYFMVCIIYSDFQDYIQWIRKNNKNTLQFNNDNSNQQQLFTDYIDSRKNQTIFQNNLSYISSKYFVPNKMKNNNYLYTFMRKSLLDFQFNSTPFH
jgi:hypothetical protein